MIIIEVYIEPNHEDRFDESEDGTLFLETDENVSVVCLASVDEVTYRRNIFRLVDAVYREVLI